MANETKYGVISDIHQNPGILPKTLETLKNQGIDKLLVNGDIGTMAENLKDSQNFTAYILDNIAKSGIEAYIQPGSHETIGAFEPVMEYFKDKNSNIIDTKENPKLESKDHSLVFLPGSDWNVQGGEYTLIDDENIQTGLYKIPTNNGDQIRYFKNMNDLEKQLKDPERTISVCHVPRKFNSENCVDEAYFAETSEGGVVPGMVLENQIKQQFGKDLPFKKIQEIANANGYNFKTENKGNEDLKNLYEKLGITKAVSGHFHESGHRANDSKGNPVEQGKYTNDLFWNSGYLDAGQTGILSVKDNQASYQNINVK